MWHRLRMSPPLPKLSQHGPRDFCRAQQGPAAPGTLYVPGQTDMDTLTSPRRPKPLLLLVQCGNVVLYRKSRLPKEKQKHQLFFLTRLSSSFKSTI